MTEAHVRIDEGIKRGPRKPLKIRRRSPKADLGTWVIPEGLSPQTVLQRYLTEETTSHIAAEYGVSRKALTKWLREQCPVEWKQVQIIRALDQKEQGNEALDAEDALSLACAREKLKSAQWELTALDPDYQPKQQVTIELTGDLGERLRRARERVVSGPQQSAVQQLPVIDVVPAQPVMRNDE